MRYLCTNCNYVYDEGEGDHDEGVAVGTKFCSLGDYYECPVCGDGKDGFYEITEEINFVSDNPYDSMEIDHFPEVMIEGDKIKISVGNDIHPMGESHRISSIALYDEYGELVEELFLEMDKEPQVEFDYEQWDEFEIRVRCTLHGVWGKKIML